MCVCFFPIRHCYSQWKLTKPLSRILVVRCSRCHECRSVDEPHFVRAQIRAFGSQKSFWQRAAPLIPARKTLGTDPAANYVCIYRYDRHSAKLVHLAVLRLVSVFRAKFVAPISWSFTRNLSILNGFTQAIHRKNVGTICYQSIQLKRQKRICLK